jgi:diaphanous 1
MRYDVTAMIQIEAYGSRKISNMPRLSERIDCMLYRRKLELDIEEIRPELNIVRTASQELKSSPKFKQVLHVRGRSQATAGLV